MMKTPQNVLIMSTMSPDTTATPQQSNGPAFSIRLTVSLSVLQVDKSTYFLIGDSPVDYRSIIYIFGSSRRANVTPHLTCNAATYCFRDIRGQNMGFWGPLGYPHRGDFVFGTHIYHRAKYHADRCHRRRDICTRTHTNTKIQRITADLI